jgi:hypothetical protein
VKTVKQCLRIGGTLAAISVATALALYGGARILLALESRRAASFLEELSRVQLGQSAAAVQPLLGRTEDLQFWHGMSAEQGSHFLRVDPWHFYRPFLGPHWIDALVREAIFKSGNVRRRLGLRAWVVNGRLTIKNDQVQSVSATLTVEGENEWLMADWSYASEIPPQILNSQGPLTDSEMTHYLVRWSHLHMGTETGEVIRNSITPQATPEEQHAAREVNLQCLSSMRGCHSLCDLMPEANHYRRAHNQLGWGWNSGSWSLQDHACD